LFMIVAIVAVMAVGVFYLFGRDKDACRDVIPQDATAVAMFEPADFLEQLGFAPNKAGKLVMNLEDVAEGIDLSNPVYAFVSENGLSGITLNVRDVDKLLKAFSASGYASEEQRGYQWVADKNSIGCIDKDKMLLCGPVSEMEQDALRSEMVRLMTQGHHSVPVFEKAKQQKGVLRLCTSLANLPKMYSIPLPDGIDPSHAFLSAALRIDEKAVVFSIEVEGAGNISLPYGPIQGDWIGMLPAKPFARFCANMKGEELLLNLREVPELRTALLALNMCVDADMMIKAIDGDVALVVPKLDFQHPDFLFTAKLANTDFLANADEWSQVQRTGAQNFIIEYEGKQAYFGVHEGCLYVAFSPVTADMACQKSDADDFLQAAKGKYLSASLDVGQVIDAYPNQGVAILLKTLPQVREITNAFECVSLAADSPQRIELSIQTNKPVKEIVQNLWSLLTGLNL